MKVIHLLAGAALLGWGAQANAGIFVAFQDDDVNGGAITQQTDDGGTGQIAYIQSYGAFSNTIIVQGYPSLTQPQLQTAAIDSSSAFAGTLTIYITQTDLSPIGGGLASSFTANTFFGNVTSVTMSTYIDVNNGVYTGDQLASETFTAQGSQTDISTVPLMSGLFSETTKYVLTFGNGGASANDTINITAAAVPEPASWTMMLLGFGLTGAAIRRRKAKTLLA